MMKPAQIELALTTMNHTNAYLHTKISFNCDVIITIPKEPLKSLVTIRFCSSFILVKQHTTPQANVTVLLEYFAALVLQLLH